MVSFAPLSERGLLSVLRKQSTVKLLVSLKGAGEKGMKRERKLRKRRNKQSLKVSLTAKKIFVNNMGRGK